MKVRKSSIIVAVVMAAAMAFLLCCICAEASTGMRSHDAQGNVYISETGWVQIGSDIYYVHATKSRMYAVDALHQTRQGQDRQIHLYTRGREQRAVQRSA